MEFTALEIANFVEGTIEGNPKTKVNNFAGIEDAEEGCLSFMANPKYEDHLYTTKASVLIIADDLRLRHPIEASLIRVPDPYLAFSRLLEEYNSRAKEIKGRIAKMAYVDPSANLGDNVYVGEMAFIGENATIAKNVQIHPHAYVGNEVEIGEGTIINSGVKIYHQCKIGSNCIIHSGTVIGSDGFGFAPQEDGTFQKVPQIGNVEIGNEVEIGSNCCIDRATMGSTQIKDGVKLDNLIQVAHNVIIEENTVIAALTGISGSTEIGKNCMIGGQVGFVGHISIAPGSKINAQSGVTKTIKKPNMAWNGVPAREFKESYKSYAEIKQIGYLMDSVKKLKKEIEELKTKS